MQKTRVGLVPLIIAGFAWGTAGTLGTLLSRSSGLGFLAVAGYRNTIGGLLVLAVVLLTRRFRAPRTRAGWTRVLAIGAFSGGYQMCFFTSIGLVGVPLATLVTIGSTPIIVVLVNLATRELRLSVRLLVIFALAAVGLGLLVGTPPSGIALPRLIGGIVAALGSGGCFAGISLVGVKPVADFQDATGTGLALAWSGLVVLAVASIVQPIGFTPTLPSLAFLMALGAIPTALAYLSYVRGLRTQSSTTGSLITLLEPLTGAVWAAIILNQHLTPGGIVGAALLLAAVALAALPAN